MSEFLADLTRNASFKGNTVSSEVVFEKDDVYVSLGKGQVYVKGSPGNNAYIINISSFCMDFAIRVWHGHTEYEFVHMLVKNEDANCLRDFAFSCLDHHQIVELIAKAHNIGRDLGKKEKSEEIKVLLKILNKELGT